MTSEVTGLSTQAQAFIETENLQEENAPLFSSAVEAFIDENRDSLFSPLGSGETINFSDRVKLTRPICSDMQQSLDKVSELAYSHGLIPEHAIASKDHVTQSILKLKDRFTELNSRLLALADQYPEKFEDLKRISDELGEFWAALAIDEEVVLDLENNFFSSYLILNVPDLFSSVSRLAANKSTGDEESLVLSLKVFINEYVQFLKDTDALLFDAEKMLDKAFASADMLASIETVFKAFSALEKAYTALEEMEKSTSESLFCDVTNEPEKAIESPQQIASEKETLATDTPEVNE